MVSACFRTETAWIPKLPNVRVVRTSMGQAATGSLERALERLLPNEPALILSTGFCGGLVPALHPGKLVLAETIHHRGETILIDPALLAKAKKALNAAKLDFVCGAIRSSDRVVQTKEEKQRLQSEGTIAVDMESGPLSRWSREKRFNFLCLRAVLDPVDRELPFTASSSLIRSMLRHPLGTFNTVKLAVYSGRRIGRAIPAVISGHSGGTG